MLSFPVGVVAGVLLCAGSQGVYAWAKKILAKAKAKAETAVINK